MDIVSPNFLFFNRISLDPTGIDVLARVLEAGNSTFRVEYTPLLAGENFF